MSLMPTIIGCLRDREPSSLPWLQAATLRTAVQRLRNGVSVAVGGTAFKSAPIKLSWVTESARPTAATTASLTTPSNALSSLSSAGCVVTISARLRCPPPPPRAPARAAAATAGPAAECQGARSRLRFCMARPAGRTTLMAARRQPCISSPGSGSAACAPSSR